MSRQQPNIHESAVRCMMAGDFEPGATVTVGGGFRLRYDGGEVWSLLGSDGYCYGVVRPTAAVSSRELLLQLDELVAAADENETLYVGGVKLP